MIGRHRRVRRAEWRRGGRDGGPPRRQRDGADEPGGQGEHRALRDRLPHDAPERADTKA